uniref:DUF4359 domain-containing protein n=1 Tax=Panagrellus redivivus TaxID=6233 RepID=A0A7E4VH10_PANRE
MVSFLKNCFTVILFSTLVLNAESKQPEYSDGNTNTINIDCDFGDYDEAKAYKNNTESLKDKYMSLLNCNYTLHDVKFQFDMILAGRKDNGRQNFIDAYFVFCRSLNQMEIKISSDSFRIMEMFSSLNQFDDNKLANAVRTELVRLLERNSDLEPFSLPALPQLETIMRVTSIEMVEPKMPLAYFGLFTLRHILQYSLFVVLLDPIISMLLRFVIEPILSKKL